MHRRRSIGLSVLQTLDIGSPIELFVVTIRSSQFAAGMNGEHCGDDLLKEARRDRSSDEPAIR